MYIHTYIHIDISSVRTIYMKTYAHISTCLNRPQSAPPRASLASPPAACAAAAGGRFPRLGSLERSSAPLAVETCSTRSAPGLASTMAEMRAPRRPRRRRERDEGCEETQVPRRLNPKP